MDPIYEVTGITKAFDGGPALLFEKIKGFPNTTIVSSLFATQERMASLFGVSDPKKLKFKYLEGMKNTMPHKEVDSAPCQEVVITKNIDVLNTIPVVKHIKTDPGRVIGGGNALIMDSDIGSCISFKRTHFRGKDWASMGLNPGSHMEHHISEQPLLLLPPCEW